MLTNFRDFKTSSSSLEVELTSICNSRCVGCSRFKNFYFDNPHFVNGKYLDIELFLERLHQWKNLDFILFCGNYGDPVLHPQFIELMKELRRQKGEMRILVHSNASFGAKKFWSELGSIFSSKGSYIKFSIDGSKISHEAFRRGTDWNKVIENAEAFIAEGGNAIWQMIDFKHNHEDIENCRKLSMQMGFKRFDLRKNNYPGLDDYILASSSAVRPEVSSELSLENLESWHSQHLRETLAQEVACKSLERKNLYLDVHGHLWPCCWVGGLPYRPEDHLRQHFIKKFLNGSLTNLDQISIEKVSLEKILSSNVFSSIQAAIDQVNFSTCKKTCGKCS